MSKIEFNDDVEKTQTTIRMTTPEQDLCYAAARGDLKTVQRLVLEQGVDINTQKGTRNRQTPVMCACSNVYSSRHPKESLNCVKWLVENGAIETTDMDLRSTFEITFDMYHFKTCEILFESESFRDYLHPFHHETPLMKLGSSSLKNHQTKRLFQILLENGANVNITNKRGETAIDVILPTAKYPSSASLEYIKLLLEHGADFDGKTLARCQNPELLQIFLDCGFPMENYVLK